MADKNLFLKRIYGELGATRIVNTERLNANEDFSQVLENLFTELGETQGALYYDLAKFLLEENPEAKASAFIKENADEIAKSVLAHSLRFLRHPNASKQYRPFLEDSHLLEDSDWEALEYDLLDRNLTEEADCEKFAKAINTTLANMSGDKIDALLAVRYDKNTADKTAPETIRLYEAAMEDLKKAVQ